MGIVLAPLLRRAFIDRKTRAMRRPYRINPRHDDLESWQKTGELCYQLRATPEQYMDALFDESREKHGPFPNALSGAWARKAYIKWAAIHCPGQDRSGDVNLQDMGQIESDLKTAMSEAEKFFSGDTIAAARSALTTIAPYMRLLMAPNDPETWEMWGDIGGPDFLHNPVLVKQADSLGLPVGIVLSKLP